jgi:hypothetical protein
LNLPATWATTFIKFQTKYTTYTKPNLKIMQSTSSEDAHWILMIIHSARHTFHFDGIDKLIELFNTKHKDEGLTLSLQMQRNTCFNTIHSILN